MRLGVRGVLDELAGSKIKYSYSVGLLGMIRLVSGRIAPTPQEMRYCSR